jgi:hypothetical protein
MPRNLERLLETITAIGLGVLALLLLVWWLGL